MEYVCDVCGWIYNEEEGYPEGGIAPGTKFEDLPEDFECPLCNVGKDQFSETYQERSRATGTFPIFPTGRVIYGTCATYCSGRWQRYGIWLCHRLFVQEAISQIF